MKIGLSELFFISACCLLVSCSTPSSGPVAITKVNPYHLQTASLSRTEDEMIRFEERRRLYGAIGSSEIKERYGNYFTIFWKSRTRNPATVRLEYRQGSTGFQVHTQEQAVAKPKFYNSTKFQVTGPDYQTNGKVTQWRATIIEDGSVVAEYKSFLWQ